MDPDPTPRAADERTTATSYTPPADADPPPERSDDARPHPLGAERDAAFEREMLAALPHVARFAHSLARDEADADDLVQETFLRAYRAYHTYDPSQDARRWLFTICRHAFVRQRVRESRVVTTDDGGDPELDALAAARGHAELARRGEDDLFDRMDLRPAIDAAIAELPDAFRVAVVLVDVEGQSYEEAAAVAAVPVGTIRSRLFRARRALQEKLIAYARDAGVAAPSGPTRRAAVARPRLRR